MLRVLSFMEYRTCFWLGISLFGASGVLASERLVYPIVDTGQTQFYGDRGAIPEPHSGQAFFGQDAQYGGLEPSYENHADGTVSDVHTGLMWTHAPIEGRKLTYNEALRLAEAATVGGYTDWRLPSIKALYSLIDFSGGMALYPSEPYIDTDAFMFTYGDSSKGEREIDSQYWTSTEYVGTTMGGNPTVFGVNFADGRIKGYPKVRKRNWVLLVRGNEAYGQNAFVDNRDATITDQATGLMWMQGDSGKGMNWRDALEYAEGSTHAGYSDWRLPNAKELQSIVDYSRAPDARDDAWRGPAIDPLFEVTEVESYYWSSTTHLENPFQTGAQAVYVCFGQSFGYFAYRGSPDRRLINVHGAGAQRSDPKSGNPHDRRWQQGHGPQGDDVRILNYVRLVRDAD